MGKPSPFALVDAVSQSKEDVVRSGAVDIATYNAFVTNRLLSYHADSVLYANDLNVLPHLRPIEQYDYLMHSLRPRKRWAKWHEKIAAPEDEAAVMRCYGYNRRRAREALAILTEADLEKLRKRANRE